MPRNFKLLALSTLAFLSAAAPAAKPPSMPEVLKASSPADWQPLDPDNPNGLSRALEIERGKRPFT